MLIGLVALAAMPDLTSSETGLVYPVYNATSSRAAGLLAQILIVFLIGVLAVGLSTRVRC